MKNKKIILIGLIFICVVAVVYAFGRKGNRNILLVPVPYSEKEILEYLENHYNEKFAIKEEIALHENTKNKSYVAYPISNETIEFYVYDALEGGIGLWGSTPQSRKVYDTYTNSLLLKDLPTLKSIYLDISVEEYNVNNGYFVTNLTSGSYMQEITLSFDNSYHNVDNVSNKFIEVYNYIQDNLSKYKAAHTKISISTIGVRTEIDGSTLNVQDIKNNIIGYLVAKYREDGNYELFDIPADIKEKYPVKDIGWGNLLTKVYVNGELFDIKHYDTVKAVYSDGNLQIDGIDILLSGLKNHLELVDYNTFSNIDKIEDEIIYAYEKEDNIYILTKGDRGGISIYKYENSEISFIKDGWESMSSQELDKYFGVKVSYDFEKEILNIKY